jgi:arylformamidase
MFEYKKIYDISVLLGVESIDYPGDTPYSRKVLHRVEEGSNYTLSSFELSQHSGTHFDEPAHFITDGKTIDQYKPIDFFLPALVVDIEDKDAVNSESLKNIPIQLGWHYCFALKTQPAVDVVEVFFQNTTSI